MVEDTTAQQTKLHILAISIEASRTRCDTAFWACTLIAMCFRSDNETVEVGVALFSLVCAGVFFFLESKLGRSWRAIMEGLSTEQP